MEDAALAEPEGDVLRPAVIAEADEVAGAGSALSISIAATSCWCASRGMSRPKPPVGHVHQPRAVDSPLAQSTPFVRRAQVSAGFRDRVTLARRRQLRVT